MAVSAFRKASWAQRVGDFWALIKSKQTMLLLVTGFCSYALSRGWPFQSAEALWMAAGLALSISGCTALNMLIDRDVDARMARTSDRPLPAGRLRPAEAAGFGIVLSLIGLAISFALDRPFGGLIALGFLLDLGAYSLWLKRRSPLSILFGGVSGGMPVLAGRVLALGRVDLVGLLLAASILLWIPSHILTLSLRYADDYRRAGVPVWPNVYGTRSTRAFVAGANLLNAVVLSACALLLRVHALPLGLLLGMGLGMFGLAVQQLLAPTERRNWRLFKVASLYMLVSSILLTVGTLLPR